MRPLLFLAHRIPYPPDKGDKIRSYHILRYLAERFEVHLGCFTDESADKKYLPQLREICAEVFCLPLRAGHVATAAMKALVSGRSMSEMYYSDGRMSGWVSDALQSHSIEDIFVFCSAMAPYALPNGSGRRLIVDAVDVDSEKWSAYARSSSAALRPVFQRERRQVLALEKRAGEGSDRILFVSRAEATTFAALVPELDDRIGWLTNGVDSEYFDPAKVYRNPFRQDELPIVFTGAMDYRANIEAVEWFSLSCFPQVRRLHPRAQFWIVGAKPSSAVRHLSEHEGVNVTGAVPDVRPYLSHAACAVVPLSVARGIQNKVLEAMAMGKPVVVTHGACEGIEAQHGLELLVATRSGEFADRVSETLSGRWPGLGNVARSFVKRRHSWAVNLRVLDDLFLDPDGANRISRPKAAKLLPVEFG
ncbi:MAG TPA: TIGR03087 family PEP-CTERM/XrtA system glycosyltransferase [Rhizomicrobium sp.]|jgi:sugar transferase (PEP-CTERM/EpsH1 system associated)|nr:TIGR03087 family PEP-CTERM/XrtA system glycosyltransferase [Rhizomicrobium sp.]